MPADAPARPVARLEDVTRTYRRGSETVVALDGISLTVAAGEMVALVGASGCGKSTTLNLVAGVDRPTEGRVVVCGIELSRAVESQLVELRRHHIGLVYQAFHLVPHLSVRENIALPLALGGTHDDGRVDDLIERVGLGHRRRHFPSELSGGEQQRTAVARALVHRPQLLVADEPTGNLDSRTGATVLELIDQLRRDECTGLVLATHDRSLAARADRVIHLRDGQVVDAVV